MKMCQPHWDMLRAEVRAQGMGALIATSGEVAAEQMVDQVQQGPTLVNYDPLMACHTMILSRSLEGLGLMVMAPDFGCPICFLNDRRGPDGACTCGHPECPNKAPGSVPDFETWLRGPGSCVMAAREYVDSQGWLR